jgi:hypothetical protein
MLVITQSHIDTRLSRNAELLSEAARDRLIAAATQPSNSTLPRPVARIRVVLRHSVASLVTLFAIG